MNRARVTRFFVNMILVGFLCGCDPVTTHKITTTIFDGVPSMPPAEQYCREYHERARAAEIEAEQQKLLAAKKESSSEHPPFAEKQCSNCHDKNADSGFVRPLNELCFLCHPDITKKAFAHGPAAVGACLKCHSPHSSPNSFLLSAPRNEICAVCHKEARLTEGMHGKVLAKGVNCLECHDPHGGTNRYFLK